MQTLLIILLALMVFFLIPVGIDAGYRHHVFILGLKIGPLTIRLFPPKKKPHTVSVKRKEVKALTEKKRKNEHKKQSLSEILDFIKLILKVPGRFKKKLQIDYLRFRFLVATDDPFRTAMTFGTASAAFEAFFPLLDDTFNIKERDFGIAPDFLADKTELDIWLTATLHILDLFYIAALFGIEYLLLKIKQKRSQSTIERNEANG